MSLFLPSEVQNVIRINESTRSDKLHKCYKWLYWEDDVCNAVRQIGYIVPAAHVKFTCNQPFRIDVDWQNVQNISERMERVNEFYFGLRKQFSFTHFFFLNCHTQRIWWYGTNGSTVTCTHTLLMLTLFLFMLFLRSRYIQCLPFNAFDVHNGNSKCAYAGNYTAITLNFPNECV